MANALSEILLYSCIAAFVTGSAAFSASSRLFDLNGETDRVRKRQKSAIIAVDVRRFGHAINTDEVFGTHRTCRRRRTRLNSTKMTPSRLIGDWNRSPNNFQSTIIEA